MALTEFEHGITAVDTGFTRPQFDASHLIVDGGECAFVDTGTTHSVPNLLEALQVKGLAVEQVKYILLTHVHLDHAGGAGELIRHLPNATAVLHPRGGRHMIDPGRLIAGAIGVYGEEGFEQSYGEIVPVPEARVHICADGDHLQLGSRKLEFVHTDGHCRHHYCIIDATAEAMFTGDTFGVSYREFDSAKGPWIIPAATPTEFDPQAMRDSIDRLLGYQTKAAYLTHYSEVRGLPRLAKDLHGCLDFFEELGNTCEHIPDRVQVMIEKIHTFFGRQINDHGVDMPEQRRRELLTIDATLNAAGIDVWLDRRNRKPRQA